MSSNSPVVVANPPAATNQSSTSFDRSSLRFVVHLVTSSDGCYRDPEDDYGEDDFEEAGGLR
jgi:hypothetical protein